MARFDGWGVRSLVPFVWFALVIAPLACEPTVNEIPPIGETLVVVDTNMPVPRHVSRLRIDVFRANGQWFATRDVSLGRTTDWPTSFGVHLSETGGAETVTVRLRAYPEGNIRDYRGERFVARAAARDEPSALVDTTTLPPNQEPRLFGPDGSDTTPESEPQPFVTIDRLVKVQIRPNTRGSSKVLLAGACVGTMADLRGGASCVDTEGVLAPIPELAIEPTVERPKTTEVGTFDFTKACPEAPPLVGAPDTNPIHDEQSCVPGAMFQLGAADGVFGNAEALPTRVTILDPFYIDRFEVTVARWREAVAKGFKSPDASPTINDKALPKATTAVDSPTLCTYSSAPIGREDYPLTCVSWDAARAFCKYIGGDLPTEAQWEYTAGVAGRPFRTRFAWGGANEVTPTCARAVWGRGESAFEQLCRDQGYGPLSVIARADDAGDVTPTTSVINLGGNVAEWTRDAFAPMTAPCWTNAGLHEPSCAVTQATSHTIRGGSWRDHVVGLIIATRRVETLGNSAVGFRCERPVAP